MGRIELAVHTPDPARADAYDRLFAEYRELYDHFGRGASDSMHRLRALRDAALRGAALPDDALRDAALRDPDLREETR